MSKRADDFALPTEALAGLRRALSAELGADGAARALRQAGYEAGDALFERLSEGVDPDETAHTAFWRRLSSLFESLGWGSVTYEEAHPGVGALKAERWFEARTTADAARPSCFFTTGVLANILGRAAGDDVAVLQVGCTACGDDHCRFIFGGPETLETVYADLMAGQDANAALAALE